MKTIFNNTNIRGELTAKTITAENLPVKQFTDAKDAMNYICKDVGELDLTSGTHIFTNCTGTIKSVGSAKVYVTNSPGLTMAAGAIQASNWRNVYIDGVAKYAASTNKIEFNVSDYSQVYSVPQIELGDEIEWYCNVGRLGASFSMGVVYFSDVIIIGEGNRETDLNVFGNAGYNSSTYASSEYLIRPYIKNNQLKMDFMYGTNAHFEVRKIVYRRYI